MRAFEDFLLSVLSWNAEINTMARGIKKCMLHMSTLGKKWIWINTKILRIDKLIRADKTQGAWADPFWIEGLGEDSTFSSGFPGLPAKWWCRSYAKLLGLCYVAMNILGICLVQGFLFSCPLHPPQSDSEGLWLRCHVHNKYQNIVVVASSCLSYSCCQIWRSIF